MEHIIHEKKRPLHPNWKEAQDHREASKVGFDVLHHSTSKLCMCCLEPIQKDLVPLEQNTKQLEFLGFGFPLYYSFVRNCIFLLLVCVCSYNIIAINNALKDNYAFCHNPHTSEVAKHKNEKVIHLRAIENHSTLVHQSGHNLICTSWMIDFARIEKQVTTDEKVLRIVSFLIHLSLLVYIRDKLDKLKDYFDERKTSPSDYTLMLQNIPNSENTLHEIHHRINREYQNSTEKIVQIIIIPQMKLLQDLQLKKEEQIHKLKQNLKLLNKKQEQKLNSHTQIERLENTKLYEQALLEYQKLEQEAHLTESQIQSYIKSQKKEYKDKITKAEKALIIFQTEADKRNFLTQYQENGFKDQWSNVIVQQAPEPKEIIWENMFVSSRKNAWLTFVGWGLSILVLVVITVAFAFISKEKSSIIEQAMSQFRNHHNQAASKKAYIIVFTMIFLVVIFNKMGISTLFHKFTDLQRHNTTYRFQFSFCLKYCLGLFFTTALMTLIVQAFILQNYYKHDYGVIEQETIMYFVNSIFVPLFWAINPSYLFKRFKAWKDFGKKQYTQQEANSLMELPPYDVGKRYGEVMEIVWFTFLYMTLIPIGGLISCLGLSFYYWIDKYNLLRRSSMRSHVSGQLINLTMNLLDWSLFMRVIGQIIFDYQIRDGIQISSLICLAISILYIILPVGKIIQIFNHEKFNSQTLGYRDAIVKFDSTYYDQHILFSRLQMDRLQLAYDILKRNSQSLIKSGKSLESPKKNINLKE